MTRNIIGLVFWCGICLGIGGLGAWATTPEIPGWYRTLVKPSWNPPDWVFGPVWTTLYVMMGGAAWLIWNRGGVRQQRRALGLFAVQLALNAAWSWIFFNRHWLGWAAVEIVCLWIAIAVTTWAFFHRSRAAGWLMMPYLAWVSFAVALNIAIWQLNAS